MTTINKTLFRSFALCTIVGCAAPIEEASIDDGIRWVRTAAEFEALALQTYRAAAEDLDKFVEDTSWSALPTQKNAHHLPPAIITDVDETAVSNVEFQATFERPFANYKLDDWNAANRATPIPGAVEFMRQARAAGVEIFFVTNRPCETKGDNDDPCPQKGVTVQDLNEAGFTADSDHVMLSNERPQWDREKEVRRAHIAQTHRVIMLFGDDLGDFIACSRKTPLYPCTQGASAASRHSAMVEHANYWGEGWYVLPNPMHGSWTSVE